MSSHRCCLKCKFVLTKCIQQSFTETLAPLGDLAEYNEALKQDVVSLRGRHAFGPQILADTLVSLILFFLFISTKATYGEIKLILNQSFLLWQEKKNQLLSLSQYEINPALLIAISRLCPVNHKGAERDVRQLKSNSVINSYGRVAVFSMKKQSIIHRK